MIRKKPALQAKKPANQLALKITRSGLKKPAVATLQESCKAYRLLAGL